MCGEGNGTPLQYSCLENPMDGGAWWAAVHGVAKSRRRLSDFTFTFHFHALEKEMATQSSVLAWRIPGTGEPGGLLSMGSHRVRHDWSDLAAAAAACIHETITTIKAIDICIASQSFFLAFYYHVYLRVCVYGIRTLNFFIFLMLSLANMVKIGNWPVVWGLSRPYSSLLKITACKWHKTI